MPDFLPMGPHHRLQLQAEKRGAKQQTEHGSLNGCDPSENELQVVPHMSVPVSKHETTKKKSPVGTMRIYRKIHN